VHEQRVGVFGHIERAAKEVIVRAIRVECCHARMMIDIAYSFQKNWTGASSN
jgi:hypothetical protein